MRPRIRLTTSYAAHPQNFHHLSRFSTISQNSKHPNAEKENLLLTPEAHLLQSCIQQCKYIQSRRVFDEKPQRLLLALRSSKIIHAQSLKFGVGSDGPLANAIIDLYAKSGDHDFAEKVFQRLPRRDLLAWNSILSMYSKSGLLDKVVSYFGLLRNSGVLPNQFTYAIVASVSARLGNVRIGKQLHCDVIKMGFEFCSFCEGSLIDMYAKNNCMIDARQIFDGAKPRDTISWTAIIGGYVQSGMPFEALRLFEEMQKVGLLPDEVTYVTVVTACVGLGRLEEAKNFFAQICNPKVVAWNVMISGHAQKGHEVEAIDFFINMRKCGIRPTRSTLGSVLSAISNLSYYRLGVLVHALAIKEGLDSNVYVGSSLINMYAKCQKTEAAKKVFDALDEKNVVLWNTMIGCYAQNGSSFEVMDMFSVMRASSFEPDEYTHTSILSACACLDNLDLGQQLHSFIIKNKFDSNLFVANALVDMYAKCGALEDARQQFELMRNRDKVSWNAIIVGYVQEEYENQAFSMFRRMIADSNNPDEVSLSSILSACANLQAIEKGKQIHGFSVKIGLETSLFSGSSLIDMYVKCGAVEAAEKVLSSMPDWSVVSINALISGYAQERLEEAINLFQLMQAEGMDPSEITLASLLDACTDPSQLNIGRQIHSYALKAGLLDDRDFLGVSLLGMYLNCQRTADANILFHELPCPRSSILWTAVISGHIQNNNIEEALQLYQEMRRDNARPDQATYVCVLKACANLALLRDGREIHSLIFHTGYDSDESTCSALVDMYAKCGDIRSSMQVFEEMNNKLDVISWNSMIVGLAKNGYAESALKIFDMMKRKGVRPDEVTFLGVLTACSHAGKISEGHQIFDSMVNGYAIQPRMDHYACMVDLLGRWGFLKEAEEFIDKQKIEPDAMIWATLLGASSIHGDDIRGRRAAQKLIELEPQNPSTYVLLSNIYAKSGNWDEANSVRRAMKVNEATKLPGCSWILVGHQTSVFVAGDKFHTRAGEISAILMDLTAAMKEDSSIEDSDL